MFGRPLDITPDGIRDFVLTRSFGVVPREPPNDPKARLSTFVIGYVGFLIFGANSRVDRTPHIVLTPWLEERTIRLWPTIAVAITWPPAREMSLSEVLPVARLGQPDP
jgi:hypothetical protein